MDLYYYTDLESDFHRKRVLALLDGTLFLSDPSKFNDPFDCQLSLRHDDLPEGPELLPWVEKDEMGIPEKLAVCRKDWPELRRLVERHRGEVASRNYGMFCFSELWDNCLMWAHYAQRHQGVCLKLNVNLDKLPEGDWLEPVRYTSHYQVLSGQKVKDDDQQSLKTLLLTKSVDWLYEKEWRYIAPDPAPRKKREVLCGEWLIVEEVYFGSRFHEHNLLSLLKGSMEGRDPVKVKEVLEWVRDDDREKSKLDFGLNLGREQSDYEKSIAEMFSIEHVILKLKSRDVDLRKCIKSDSQYRLELGDFKYDLEKDVEDYCKELSPDPR
jgi:hypothetical protein